MLHQCGSKLFHHGLALAFMVGRSSHQLFSLIVTSVKLLKFESFYFLLVNLLEVRSRGGWDRVSQGASVCCAAFLINVKFLFLEPAMDL